MKQELACTGLRMLCLCHAMQMLLFYHWGVTEALMFVSASSLADFGEWIEEGKQTGKEPKTQLQSFGQDMMRPEKSSSGGDE